MVSVSPPPPTRRSRTCSPKFAAVRRPRSESCEAVERTQTKRIRTSGKKMEEEEDSSSLIQNPAPVPTRSLRGRPVATEFVRSSFKKDTKLKFVQCSPCKEIFPNKIQFNKHARSNHSNNARFRTVLISFCEKCEAPISSFKQMLSHVKSCNLSPMRTSTPTRDEERREVNGDDFQKVAENELISPSLVETVAGFEQVFAGDKQFVPNHNNSIEEEGSVVDCYVSGKIILQEHEPEKGDGIFEQESEEEDGDIEEGEAGEGAESDEEDPREESCLRQWFDSVQTPTEDSTSSLR